MRITFGLSWCVIVKSLTDADYSPNVGKRPPITFRSVVGLQQPCAQIDGGRMPVAAGLVHLG
jgi:hypothetical protein